MSQKLVSVIIPSYNSLKFLKDTIDCVLNQSYKNIELIVVDDGSTDGSFEYLESLKCSMIHVIKNSKKGACAARNHGLRIAMGDYIQFLDADDLLSINKIELQMSKLKNQANAIAVCNTMHFYNSVNDGIITDKEFLYTTNNSEEFLLNLYGANGKQNMVQTSAWLTPKLLLDKIGPWDETLSKDQDGEYFCRVVTRAEKVLYVPGITNYYRKHVKGSNIANQKDVKHLDSQLRALESKSEQFTKLKSSQSYKNAMALQYKIIAVGAYPKYPDIYETAISKVDYFGGSDYEPVLGGKIVEIIKSIFGWRTAKKISFFVHKHIKT